MRAMCTIPQPCFPFQQRKKKKRIVQSRITYTLVDVVPDAVRDRVKGHLGSKGGDEDGGEEDRVALDDGVVTEARKLVGGGGVVGLDGHDEMKDEGWRMGRRRDATMRISGIYWID
jgi:hypothetical protein